MVHRPRVFLRGIDPRIEHLKDEDVVFGRHPHIDDPAFEIGIALVDERRLDAGAGHRCQAEFLELVGPAPRGVSAAHYLCRQFHRRDVDHAFLGRLHHTERVVPVADHATHERRLEFDHHVPRQGHDVGLPLAGGCNQHDRPRLDQAVDLRQGKGLFHRAILVVTFQWLTPDEVDRHKTCGARISRKDSPYTPFHRHHRRCFCRSD